MIDLLRRHRLTAAGLAFAAVLLLFVAWNVLAPVDEPRVEALRKQGLPVSLKELNAWYRAVPPERNAALRYEEVFALASFSNVQGGSEPALDPPAIPSRGEHFKAEDKRELAALLAKNQEALRLLHAVPEGTPSRYSLDLNQGFLVLLPHLGKIKRAALLLTGEAMLLADNGEAEQGMGSLWAAGRLAHSLDDEPLLISQLVRLASWGVIISRVERIVNLASLPETNLVSLQQMLQAAERPEAMLRAMGGEEACGLSVFTDPRLQVQVFGPQNGTPSQSDRFGMSLAVSALKVTGLFRKDKEVYLTVMATNLAAARASYPQRIELGREAGNLSSTLPTRLCIFSRMMVPAVWRAFLRDADHTARCRAAEAALGVERFRRAHDGALPANLDALVPASLPEVPRDPYNGQPLRFKPLNPGFVVYSVGEDGNDDGGAERDSKKPNLPHDITFIVGH